MQDGYLDVPALKLDQQGHYTFTDGVTSTFFCNTASSVIGTKLQHLWVSQSKRDSLKFALTLRTCHRLLLHRDFSDAFNSNSDQQFHSKGITYRA